jgi:toxin-antitoxin system PIN domain toxin
VSRYLLDVNLLIALIDPSHIQHDRAHAWFEAAGSKAWATCPLTEIGVLRVLSHARYPNALGNPGMAAEFVAALQKAPGHEFWPDDLSMIGSDHIDPSRLLDSSQITDTYLLGLAAAHKGRLATLDRRLIADAVPKGKQALCVI